MLPTSRPLAAASHSSVANWDAAEECALGTENTGGGKPQSTRAWWQLVHVQTEAAGGKTGKRKTRQNKNHGHAQRDGERRGRHVPSSTADGATATWGLSGAGGGPAGACAGAAGAWGEKYRSLWNMAAMLGVAFSAARAASGSLQGGPGGGDNPGATRGRS
jgi:hypothetical protein